MMIKTEYWPKPDPSRSRDWCAWDDNTYEPGCPLGYGPTKQAAITDLLEQLQDQEPNS
jgi:hypothetical protein